MLGTMIDGKYRVLRTLGVGGMGAVYEAEHTGTGRRVALKVITSELARTEENVGRFQREARAAGGIDTQYIAQVLDTGVDRDTGVPFLVMELLSGEDLQTLLKRTGPVAPDLALRIIAQACLGLQKAHEAGVVHRDIKPANMFLARREAGEIITKLVDFGIAKVRDQAQETSQSGGLTKTGSLLGSPFYMSPEQALGSKEIDHRTDLWSLGITLYHALAGRTPFEHIQALGQLIVEISYGRLPPVQEFAPWVSPQVAAIVHGALQRNQNERFQSAGAMFEAIRSQLPNGWSITAEMLVPLEGAARARVEPRLTLASIPEGPASARTSPGDLPPLGGSRTFTATGVERPPIPPEPRPTSLKTFVAAMLAVAAVSTAGGYMVWRRSHAAPPVEPHADMLPTKPTPPIEAPTSTPAVPPSVATTVTVVPTATQPPTRTVEVVIIPADASVEVEGQRVPVNKGIFELTGTLGSLHKVRVFKFSYETVTSVIVTDSGPRPSKIELSFGAPSSYPQRGGLTPGTRPTTTPGTKRTFE